MSVSRFNKGAACVSAAFLAAWPLYSQVTVHSGTNTYHEPVPDNNIAALWIQKTDGTFIKTLQIMGLDWYTSLKNYTEALDGDGPDTVDAVTQASPRWKHGDDLEGRWGLMDREGNAVGNGTYEFCAEFTEDEWAGPDSAYHGKFAKGEIEIDGTAKTANGDTSSGYFTGFTAVYAPGAVRHTPVRVRRYSRSWYRLDNARQNVVVDGCIISGEPASVHIFDSRGETIERFKLLRHAARSDITVPAPKISGVYILRVFSAGGETVSIPVALAQ